MLAVIKGESLQKSNGSTSLRSVTTRI